MVKAELDKKRSYSTAAKNARDLGASVYPATDEHYEGSFKHGIAVKWCPA